MTVSAFRACVLFVLVVGLLCVSTVSARDASEEYADHLARIDTTIKKGDYKKGVRKARQFEREMLDWIIVGPKVPEYLGEIAKLYAVAPAGVDNLEHAAWKWHMAVNFSSDLEESVLADYGEAGENLLQYLEEEGERYDEDHEHSGDLSPPKVKKKIRPRYPGVQAKLDLHCSLHVQVVIGVDGVPYLPMILESAGRPTLVYTTLDALRRWRFEPAKIGDKPVPMFYVLNTTFDPH